MGLFNWFRRDSGPSAPGRPDDAYRALLERPDPGMAPWFATDTSLISDAGPVRSNNASSSASASAAGPSVSIFSRGRVEAGRSLSSMMRVGGPTAAPD